MKAGVYSGRALKEREAEIRKRLGSCSFDEVCREFKLDDLCSMLALRDLLKDDLAEFGTVNRRREPRRQLDLLLSVSRRIEKRLAEVAKTRNAPGTPNADLEIDPADHDSTHLIVYRNISSMAFGDAPDITPGQQMRAIAELLNLPQPRRPDPLDRFSDEDLTRMLAILEAGEPMPDEYLIAKVDWPIEDRPQERQRCIEELIAIAARTRDGVRASDQLTAVRMLRKLAPDRFPGKTFIEEELEAMSEEELDAALDALLDFHDGDE